MARRKLETRAPQWLTSSPRSGVTDLITEISTATGEQSVGIGQVSEAVNQLDQVTQQNAALVEESAAAADSLNHQAAGLVDAVCVFKPNPRHIPAQSSRDAVTPTGTKLQVKAQRATPVPPTKKVVLSVVKTGKAAASVNAEWESF